MTKKDFFIVLIKVYGLYSVIVSIFTILPQTISYISMDMGTEMLIITLFSIALIVSLFVLLIFKSEYITEKLKLADGFDEDRIEFKNFNSENIVKLASLLLGGYLFITNIPVVLNLFYAFLKLDQEGLDFGEWNNFDLGIGILNLFVGYLLFTNFQWIAKKLTSNKDSNEHK